MAKIMNSLLPNSALKKVGKTTRLFRHDLNQISYDYTVEVTNRFKGLNLIDRVPEELWMEVCDIVQEAVIKIIPKKKNSQKAKWLSEEALQIAEKRREAKKKKKERKKREKKRRQRRKGKVYQSECSVPKNNKVR